MRHRYDDGSWEANGQTPPPDRTGDWVAWAIYTAIGCVVVFFVVGGLRALGVL